PVFDLWANDSNTVPQPGRVRAFRGLADLVAQQPAGTRLVPLLRTGSTPTPEDRAWTGWTALDKDHRPQAPADRHRWAQLKFELPPSRARSTPAVGRFALAYDLQRDDGGGQTPLRVGTTRAPWKPYLDATSVPFVYQEPSPRLKLLRERYRLDEVI